MSAYWSARLCPQCDDAIPLNAAGWGRCRACGYESLREFRVEGEGRRRSAATTTTAERNAGLVSVINNLNVGAS